MELAIGMDALEILKKHAKACAIEMVSGPLLDQALEEVKKAIPGMIDDTIIEMLKAPLKAEVLKLIEKV